MATKVLPMNEASDNKASGSSSSSSSRSSSSSVGVEADDNFDDVDWSKRPQAPGCPVRIQVVIQFQHWEIAKDGGKEMLTWSGVLELYWVDPRLDGFPRSRKVPESIWKPGVTGSRGFDLGEAERKTKLPTFNGKKDGRPDLSNGGLCLKADFRLGNGGLNLSNHLKRFRAFPYDSTRVDTLTQFWSPSKEHAFPAVAADSGNGKAGGGEREGGDDDSSSAHGTWNSNQLSGANVIELQLTRPNLPHRVKDGEFQHVDWVATRHSDDYALVCLGYAIGSNHVGVWGNPTGSRTSLCLSLQIARTPNFYEHKSIVPLYLVLIFGFLTYYSLEPSDLPSRISVVSALFLTVFGIQWLSIERLPRLPFNTILDTVASSAIAGLMLMLVGACTAYKLAQPTGGRCGGGDGACAEEDDFLFDYGTAATVDMVVTVAAGVFIVCYAFLYGLLYQRSKINREVGWSRPWREGKSLGNMKFAPHKGMAYRLYTTEAWAEEHENKFMGEGTAVNFETW